MQYVTVQAPDKDGDASSGATEDVKSDGDSAIDSAVVHNTSAAFADAQYNKFEQGSSSNKASANDTKKVSVSDGSEGSQNGPDGEPKTEVDATKTEVGDTESNQQSVDDADAKCKL